MSRLHLPVLFLTLAATACGSSGDATRITSTIGSARPQSTTTSIPIAGSQMRGLRYCEILLLTRNDLGLVAEVYNTYPLNDCPPNLWDSLDAGAVAAEAGVPFALANGPRFWLMDSVEKIDRDTITTKEFGGLAMNRYAQVVVGNPETVGRPYSPQSVDRKSRFTFLAGQTVYVLTAPDGTEYVMQSWSQQRDPLLSEADLADLGSRLQLPTDWTYASRVLTADLVIDTTSEPAQVLQDELMNSYSRIG